VGVIPAYICVYVGSRPRRYITTATHRPPCCCATPTHTCVPLQSRTHNPIFRFKSSLETCTIPRLPSCLPPILRCCLTHFDIANSENYDDTAAAGREALSPIYISTYCTTDSQQSHCLPLFSPAAACIAHSKPRLTQHSVIHTLSRSSDLVRRGGVRERESERLECSRARVWSRLV
jgi:hypothetical protein